MADTICLRCTKDMDVYDMHLCPRCAASLCSGCWDDGDGECLDCHEEYERLLSKMYDVIEAREQEAHMIPSDCRVAKKEPIKPNYRTHPHLKPVRGPLALASVLMSKPPVNNPPRPLEPVAATTYEDSKLYSQTNFSKVPSWIDDPHTVFFCHLHRHLLGVGYEKPPSCATCNGCELGSDNF